MFRIISRAVEVLTKEGPIEFAQKTVEYKRRKNRAENNGGFISVYKDILFINGCTLEHPSRYRVKHQIEQLHFNNISCDEVFYLDLQEIHLNHYRGFIFYRCPHTNLIERFIKNAKENNKVTFFDIDDLVIDGKYTSQIKHLDTLSEKELAQYSDGVYRMKKTLKLCDYAITTTETLKTELKNYCSGEIFINKNVASEEMVKCSLDAVTALKEYELAKEKKFIKEEKLIKKEKFTKEEKFTELQKKYFKDSKDKFIIGYFSGSITHNEDFDLIKNVILKLIKKYNNVNLLIMGELDIPDEFEDYKNQVICVPFLDWRILPQIIAMTDINVVPLVDTIFNAAKSENKWNEASLVKTVTIASPIGPFKDVIRHGENGLLAANDEEWFDLIEKCINKEINYKKIAETSFYECSENNVTSYTGKKLRDFITSKLHKNALFVLPSCKISGGVNVIFKHAQILKSSGVDVLILSMDDEDINEMVVNDVSIPVISSRYTSLHANYDVGIATLWTTCEFVMLYPKIHRPMYMVQNFETNFYEFGNFNKLLANITYSYNSRIEYTTISKWCQEWLEEKFQIQSKYVRNGLDTSLFKFRERDFTGKIRVLIEGNSNDFYKNVDESFIIANELDKSKYEIWYLSYAGKPKKWYEPDKVFNRVPYDEVGEVYGDCHILLKTSTLESFSYPPLEMMSTGGISIVRKNGGNVEYLKNGYNCLMYDDFDLESVLELFKNIADDAGLRDRIIENGKATVEERKWENIENDVIDLYLNEPKTKR